MSLPDLMKDFIEAVEKNLRVTLTQMVPLDRELEVDDEKVNYLSKKKPYFTAAKIEIPVQGVVIEAIPLKHMQSKEMLGYCETFPEGLFPHIPKNHEIIGFSFVPKAMIKMPDGTGYFVEEKLEDILELIQKERIKLKESAADAVAQGIKKVLMEQAL